MGAYLYKSPICQIELQPLKTNTGVTGIWQAAQYFSEQSISFQPPHHTLKIPQFSMVFPLGSPVPQGAKDWLNGFEEVIDVIRPSLGSSHQPVQTFPPVMY